MLTKSVLCGVLALATMSPLVVNADTSTITEVKNELTDTAAIPIQLEGTSFIV